MAPPGELLGRRKHRVGPAAGPRRGFRRFRREHRHLGIDWKNLPIGTRVRLGAKAVVEITQIGKECHNRCAIYYKAGDCIMPREGVFGRVLEEGPFAAETRSKCSTGQPIHWIMMLPSNNLFKLNKKSL
jgi:MOSC domain-containing protein YiiM